MKYIRPLLFTLLVFSTLAFDTPARADSCASKANALVAGNPRLTLLSVQRQASANGSVVCVARIHVAAANGKPARVVVRRFSP